MDPRDLYDFAFTSVASPDPVVPEASYRRSISSAYYALFHYLAAEGAKAFLPAGPAVTRQAARMFSHGEMKKVCLQYQAWKPSVEHPILNVLAPMRPDPDLINVAAAFIKLQEAREIADYDLDATVSRQDAVEALSKCLVAVQALERTKDQTPTRAFLAALLLGDRLKQRRG